MSATELAIVHFSGHGSHDGRLLGVDADTANLSETAIDISAVTNAMAAIRARHVIVTLDSCFAGTIRGVEGSPSDAVFKQALLALAGAGSRTVAWGAGPFEPARESPALRHGVFSSGLVRGLYGEAVVAGDRLKLLNWLDNAMQFTREHARTTGMPQTPGAHLHVSGEAILPAVRFGPRQRVLRELDDIRSVTPEPQSLRAAYPWVDDGIAEAFARRLGPTRRFNEMQVEAISRAGVLAGRNVTVAAPTAAGKTVVGELAVVRAVKAGARAVIVLPMRALVSEQWEAFRDHYSDLGFQVIRSCGDIADDDAAFEGKQFDVAFVTYEKLVGRLMANPALLDGVGAVVLDEVQLIGDASRGRTVELLVSRIRRRVATADRIQVVALCGEVGELNRLPDWLSSELVVERVRPVPLLEGVVHPSGVLRTRGQAGEDLEERKLPGFPVKTNDIDDFRHDERVRTRMAAAAAADAASLGQVLVFRTTRPDVLETAAAIAAMRLFPPAKEAIARITELAERFEPARVRELLASSLEGGVGVHLSDLGHAERSIVEGAFRAGEIRVLCSTTTLAMGMNLPARTVIIADDGFYNGERNANDPISVVGYRQMAGRAGRNLAVTADGRSLLVAATEEDADRYQKTYVGAIGEGLKSGLAGMAAEDLVLALLALTGGAYGKDLEAAAFDTFWAYSERATLDWRNNVRARLESAIAHVEKAEFLARLEDNRLQLTALGRICAADGIGFGSAIRLLAIVDRMVSAGEPFDADSLIALIQTTDELDRIAPPRVSKKRATETRARLGEAFPTKPILRQGVEGALTGEHLSDHRVASRVIRYVVLRRWVDGHSVLDIEARYSGSSDKEVLGFGPFLRASDRTADLLPPVAALIAVRRPELKDAIVAVVTGLKGRIRHGVSDAGEPLMRLGIGLQRSEAESLAKAGVARPVDLASALLGDSSILESILGTNAVHALRAAMQKKRKGAGEAATAYLEPEPDLFAV